MSATVTQYDLDNMEAILGGSCNHYSARLYRLMKAADIENRALLATIYPDHARALEIWEHAEFGSRVWRCYHADCLRFNTRSRKDERPSQCKGCGAYEPREAPKPRSE